MWLQSKPYLISRPVIIRKGTNFCTLKGGPGKKWFHSAKHWTVVLAMTVWCSTKVSVKSVHVTFTLGSPLSVSGWGWDPFPDCICRYQRLTRAKRRRKEGQLEIWWTDVPYNAVGRMRSLRIHGCDSMPHPRSSGGADTYNSLFLFQECNFSQTSTRGVKSPWNFSFPSHSINNSQR